ncbi:electron transport complex protein RnfC [Allopseudospirillum japonicum]|uniref:Ion-translocating oxidoreductase complex subunit C n=1 Tax=Allopseudospirillum japonicum TaxID=64971 RepID=A0A1H6QH01_9GAMM|nr:electron transport complex subunit RsxC [Allopseudospirillum japonicum]SEI38262.1 electron transport complex protein RnfC [Allopseudospirillum japonicum]
MAKIWDFHGGIHPAEHKDLSLQVPLRQAPLPAYVVLPLQQHIGAPARPLVRVGDKVRTGQKIADRQAGISACVHASISGTVVAIEERPIAHPSQMQDMCIVIESDGQDTWVERAPLINWQSANAETLLAHIKGNGIVGLGGAGFPTLSKIQSGRAHQLDTLIINAAECEPYITADDTGIRHYPQELVTGIRILQRILQPQQTLIGIEDNKPDAIERLREATIGTNIEIRVVPTKYPSGGEKQLTYLLTGREVPSGGLPADVGVLCQNVGTLIAVARALVQGEPLVRRIVTLTGHALAAPANLEVRLGTPIDALLRVAQLDPQKLARLILGGPMMGFSLPNAQVPITKTSNCVIAGTLQEFPSAAPEMPCIRCGMCEQACPASLLPQQLYWFSKAKEFDKARLYNLFDCIECGACAYVCPSQIPLVQYYRFAKGEIRKEESEALKAERARQRFEFKQERQAREQAEKAARRQGKTASAVQMEPSVQKAAAPASTETLDLKKLKIQLAAKSVAAKKAQQALTQAQEAGASAEELAELTKTFQNAQQEQAQAQSAIAQATETPTATQSPSPDVAELKKLKIQLAAKSVAAKKAQQALTQAQEAGASAEELAELTKTFQNAQQEQAQAQSAIAQATETPTSTQSQSPDVAELKKLKIQLAAKSVAAKKAQQALTQAQEAGASAEELAELTQVLQEAQQAQSQAQAALEQQQVPKTQHIQAPPKAADAHLKQLSVQIAVKKVAFRKAEQAWQQAHSSQQGDLDVLEAHMLNAQEALHKAQAELATYQAQQSSASNKQVTQDGDQHLLKKRKIAVSVAQAAVRSAQKRLDNLSEIKDTPSEQLAAQQARLASAQAQLAQAQDALAQAASTRTQEIS